MDLKRNIAMILCISIILSVSSCGMTKREEESSGKLFTHKSEKSVLVGYIVLKDDEKSADLYDEIDGNVIVKMFSGNMVTVYSIGSEWAEVNYSGKDGYMKIKYISFSEPEKKEDEESAEIIQTSERKVSVRVEHVPTEFLASEIPFTVLFPKSASGRFVIDFVMTNENGSTTTYSTDEFIVPKIQQVSHDIAGSGENVPLTVLLKNTDTDVTAEIGTYLLNFINGDVTVITEDIMKAFEDVGGFGDLPDDFDHWADEYGYYDAYNYYHPYIAISNR